MFLSLYIWMNALDLQQFGSVKSSDEGNLIYYSQMQTEDMRIAKN